ncbi:uncharacterized protein LOC125237541 [Leguminivora glycinivorella]|uniref:uncharacterized protein LOC125237541 n=1 Tax=Leguminivora glycinivorella TaxID=1035111 RepID=UPI00200D359A|nr:uncharacterized protein LOC125237541 [Leguminivora glycinivorella]
MTVKTENGPRKRWICLFTCLVIRAIHLEVVKDLSTSECLMAFRRFIATRGVPALILTDNATQFRLLGETLADEERFKTNLKWKFIPQLAPWHGGVYERLISIVKHCLKRTLEKHILTDNQLLTIMKESEAVINSRPLTYVGANVDHILKPADFLTPGKCFSVEVLTESLPLSGSLIKKQLIEGWNRGNMIMAEYKEMFLNQYLLSLRERYRNSPKQARVRCQRIPRIGDVVQIKGEAKNREGWKVGTISELIKGKDGLCRIAKVKVENGVFTRSIAHLYPLEADEDTSFQDPIRTSLDNEARGVCINLEEEESQTLPLRTNETQAYDSTSAGSSEDNHKNSNNDIENELNLNDHSELLIDSDLTQREDTAPVQTPITDTESDNEEASSQAVDSGAQRRTAAVQAMQKIHRWTRDLMSAIN